jgi:endonuclease/exonuclease/phosphatase family metal-dependent hydrolase
MSDRTATRVRVMTWNVWWRFGPDWRRRQPLILDAIRSSRADVVALQEAWGTAADTQPDAFARELGFFAAFAEPSLPPRPDPPEHDEQRDVGIGVGLLSRWPITGVDRFVLPARHRPIVPVALLASVASPGGPLHVITTATEWAPEFGDDRLAQSEALASVATDAELDGPAPVVLAADLNAAADSPVVAPLLTAMTDAWAAAGGDPHARSLPSEHPFAPDVPELLDRRIDHVLFRPGAPGRRVEASRAVLAGGPVGGLDPSDHRAVVCDLAWR